eukprot:s889_g20.t1
MVFLWFSHGFRVVSTGPTSASEEIPPDEEPPEPPMPSPLVPPSPTACRVFPRCHALGLTGACCPPAEGTPALGCCEGGPGCVAYPACVALGLSDCCSPEDPQPHQCCAAGAGACEAYQACVDSGLTVGTCCATEGPRHPCCRGIVVPQQNKLAESLSLQAAGHSRALIRH